MRLSKVRRIQAVVLSAALVGLIWTVGTAIAQAPADIQRIEDKIEAISSQDRSFAIELERRLTRLESQIEIMNRILIAAVGALTLQLAETLWGVIVARNRSK